MSKIHAYKCDYCGKLVIEDECMGLSPLEDIFDKLLSFKTIYNPSKADVHFCISHFADLVTGPAAQAYDRRHNEDGYKLKIKELSYDLRKTTIDRHRAFALAQVARKR